MSRHKVEAFSESSDLEVKHSACRLKEMSVGISRLSTQQVLLHPSIVPILKCYFIKGQGQFAHIIEEEHYKASVLEHYGSFAREYLDMKFSKSYHIFCPNLRQMLLLCCYLAPWYAILTGDTQKDYEKFSQHFFAFLVSGWKDYTEKYEISVEGLSGVGRVSESRVISDDLIVMDVEWGEK